MNDRGTALIAVLGLTMILLPLGAFAVLQCRTDFLIQRNLRAEIETFYGAEAGLAYALAAIQRRSFDSIVLGPDGIPNTDDDGDLPIAVVPSLGLHPSGLRCDVWVEETSRDQLRLRSRASSPRAANTVLEALVTRAPLPYTPAALYVEADRAGFDLASGRFRVSGIDPHPLVPPREAIAGGDALPAVSSPSADMEARLRRQLSAQDARQLTGAGGSPSIATTPPLGLETYAARFINAPRTLRLLRPEGQLGTSESPTLAVVPGDLVVSGRLSGAGVLVVQGTFHVAGTFTFSGLVLAMGGVWFEPSSHVEIAGAVWRGASQDERLWLQGSGAIVYRSDALARVERAYPGLLPRASTVVGWREVL